jgi:hypothetical protein
MAAILRSIGGIHSHPRGPRRWHRQGACGRQKVRCKSSTKRIQKPEELRIGAMTARAQRALGTPASACQRRNLGVTP